MYFLPYVHIFPNIIHQCHANYDPNLRAIMSPNQTIIFIITIDSINEMLQFHSNLDLTPISLGDFLKKLSKLSQYELRCLCQTFVDKEHQPKNTLPYLSIFFTDIGKTIVDMIVEIMGFNTSEYVDELALVLISIFTPSQPPIVKYNYAAFIAEKIHDQFKRLENEKVFKYSTFIYHPILYYQSEKFPFSINKLDTKGNPKSAIFWTSIFHHSFSCPYSYNEFIDQFVHPVTTILTGNPPTRISDEIKRILQLSKQYKVSDWYMYKNNTKIRIYGYELPPFKLPKYVPMRLLPLEYYRKNDKL